VQIEDNHIITNIVPASMNHDASALQQFSPLRKLLFITFRVSSLNANLGHVWTSAHGATSATEALECEE